MVGREAQEACAEQGVGPGGVDLDAVLEADPRAPRRDQRGDPATVGSTPVVAARIDAHLFDEHRDRRAQVGLEFQHRRVPDERVRRDLRGS